MIDGEFRVMTRDAQLEAAQAAILHAQDATRLLKERVNMLTADVVEVVRCKDCKHYDGSWFCDINGVPSRKHDDFCSYGERKDPWKSTGISSWTRS